MRGRASIAALGGAAADSCSRWAICQRSQLGAIAQTEFFINVVQMKLHRAFSQIELPGQMFVGPSTT